MSLHYRKKHLMFLIMAFLAKKKSIVILFEKEMDNVFS